MGRAPDFWDWFLGRNVNRAGWRKFLNRWLLLHVALGVALSVLVPLSLMNAATAVLLPLAGVFVGMSFAWAGNAQALLQASEMEVIASHHDGGLAEYVHTYQLAVLAILATLTLWGLAGLGVFDRPCVVDCPRWGYQAAEIMLFAFASITLRECWHVVLAAHWMLLAQRVVRQREAVARREIEASRAQAASDAPQGHERNRPY